MKNDVRQGQDVSIQASNGNETAAPIREPEKRTPLALPRSSIGSQLQMARALPGNAPASAIPKTRRMATRETKLHAAPVSAVSALHSATTTVSATRGPALSAIQPAGI